MPAIKQEHALYLYKLLKSTIGLSKQTPLLTVEQILTNDNLTPQDFGFDNIRTLMEACADFIKVTAFKKGYVYATLLLFDTFETALLADEKNVKIKNNGKPWKRHRNAKSIRAIKPKHLVPKPKQTNDTNKLENIGSTPEEPEEPQIIEQEPATPEPTISLTVTYNPYNGSNEEKTLKAAPEALQSTVLTSDSDNFQHPQKQTQDVQSVTQPVAIKNTHPKIFEEEVHIDHELLDNLYQMTPMGTNVIQQLEDDFKLAQSSHTLKETGGILTFPIRYKNPQNNEVIYATIRKSKRGLSRPWTLSKLSISSEILRAQSIDMMTGLPKAGITPWEKLPAAPRKLPVNPVEVVMKEVPVSDWTLLAAPLLNETSSIQVAQACLSTAYVFRKNNQQLMHNNSDFLLPVLNQTPQLFDEKCNFDKESSLVKSALQFAQKGWRMAVQIYNPSQNCTYLALPAYHNEKLIALVFDNSEESKLYTVIETLNIEEAYPLARIFSDGLPQWILPK